MIERPILFNSAMVNATHADIKTQTRRTKGLEKINNFKGWGLVYDGQELLEEGRDLRTHYFEAIDDRGNFLESYYVAICPFGKVGDQFWVKENYRLHRLLDDKKASDVTLIDTGVVIYEADNVYYTTFQGKLRPSIHMTRWASRTDLLITAIRAERIQDITEADALAEGITKIYSGVTGADIYAHYGAVKTDLLTGKKTVDPKFADKSAKGAFEKLWVAIEGQASWDANPWVWVITYQRLKNNLPNPLIQGE